MQVLQREILADSPIEEDKGNSSYFHRKKGKWIQYCTARGICVELRAKIFNSLTLARRYPQVQSELQQSESGLLPHSKATNVKQDEAQDRSSCILRG